MLHAAKLELQISTRISKEFLFHLFFQESRMDGDVLRELILRCSDLQPLRLAQPSGPYQQAIDCILESFDITKFIKAVGRSYRGIDGQRVSPHRRCKSAIVTSFLLIVQNRAIVDEMLAERFYWQINPLDAT